MKKYTVEEFNKKIKEEGEKFAPEIENVADYKKQIVIDFETILYTDHAAWPGIALICSIGKNEIIVEYDDLEEVIKAFGE